MTTEKRCKDCLREFVEGAERGEPVRLAKRPIAADSGGRCATHWRVEKRRRRAANAEKRVQRVYNLPKGDYARLYEFQLGHCALCRRSTGASRRLAVDHDHGSGDVRGLCCSVCNKWILGHARDSIEFFQRCIAYLEDPPYRRMKEGRPFHE